MRYLLSCSGKICILLTFSLLMSACSSSKKIQQESNIGIIHYLQYELKLKDTEDTSFYAITEQAIFDKTFRTTTTENAKTPDFSGHIAVTIANRSGQPLKIQKATISGYFLNIYAIPCENGTLACPTNRLTVATTPRSQHVKQVRFFINNSVVKTLPVSIH